MTRPILKLPKKITASLLLMAIVVSLLGTPLHQTQALTSLAGGAIVLDPVNLAENSASVITLSGIFGYTVQINIKEFLLDYLAWNIAKMALKQITVDVVDWINSGFAGSPAFIQNYDQYLLNVADRTFGFFINDTLLDFVCEPFQLDVQIALDLAYSRNRLNDPNECTLTGSVENIERFFSGTFQEGGWQRWIQMAASPQNTPQGAFLDAQASVDAKIRTASGNSTAEASGNSNFLSFHLCDTPDDGSTPPVQDGTKKPESDCWVTMPGKFIADQLTWTVQNESQALIEADEINEILGALFGQLVSRVFKGFSGVLGLSDANYQDRQGSFLEQMRAEPVGVGNTYLTSQARREANELQDYLDEFSSINPPVTQRRSQLQTLIDRGRADYGSCFAVSLSDYTVFADVERAAAQAAAEVPTMISRIRTEEAYLAELESRLIQSASSLTGAQTSGAALTAEVQAAVARLEALKRDPAYLTTQDRARGLSALNTYEELVRPNGAIEQRIAQERARCHEADPGSPEP